MNERVDWAAVRERLAELEASLSAGFEIGQEEREQVYRERAAQLARETLQEHDRGEIRNLLIVGNEDCRCALPLEATAGVIEPPPATPLPGGTLDVICHRGEFWSLISLRDLLGSAASWPAETEDMRAVLLRHPQWRLACACPGVVSITAVHVNALTRSEDDTPGVTHYFRDDDQFVAVIGVDALFSSFNQTEEGD